MKQDPGKNISALRQQDPGRAPLRSDEILDLLPVAVIGVDETARLTFANVQAMRVFGLSSDEIPGGRRWIETIHPEDRWVLTSGLGSDEGGQRKVRLVAPNMSVRLADVGIYPGDSGGIFVFTDTSELSEVEEALFQSEALYQAFLEQSPLGIIHVDNASVVTFQNHRMHALMGEDVGDAWIGREIGTITYMPPVLVEHINVLLGDGGAFHDIEFDWDRSSDQRLTVRASGSAIHHPGGGIVGGVIMIEDVTDAREKAEELNRRQRYQRATSSMREIAIRGRQPLDFVIEAVAVVGETMGAAEAHLLEASGGDSGSGIVSWAAGQGAWCTSANASNLPSVEWSDAATPVALAADGCTPAGDLYACEVRVSDRESRILVVDVADAAHADATQSLLVELGRVLGALWAWVEVSARYRLTISTIEDGLFTYELRTSENGEPVRRYVFATSQVERLAGIQESHLVANSDGGSLVTWTEHIVHADDREKVRKHDRRLVAGGQGRATYRIRTEYDDVRWLRESSYAHVGPGGTVTVTGILSDITEQKAAEQVLDRARKEAERSSSDKTAFMATMSHEIRTPLGVVHGFAELLQRELEDMRSESGDVPAVMLEFADTIRDRSQGLLDLVNDLFDLSQLEMGILPISRSRVDLPAMLGRLVTLVRPEADAKRIDIRERYQSSSGSVLADPQRLEQVVFRLLENAVKFTTEGYVEVGVERVDGDRLAISIVDSGVGIDPEYLSSIFEPFVQEDRTLARRFDGAGLGLALVSRLVEMMDGRVEASSVKGKGSTFRVILPFSEGTRVDRTSVVRGTARPMAPRPGRAG